VNLLLDTHTFLWFIAGSERLSVAARELVEASANQPFLSAASLWEMAIKLSLGRLHLGLAFEDLVPEQMHLNGVQFLGIEVEHVTPVTTLPFHHRDPFDRLLVAQAMTEQMPIVSADPAFDAYPVKRLW
jgi:PIN domain nuclease of toxin-antitoxin system